jgi:hypothetical protein
MPLPQSVNRLNPNSRIREVEKEQDGNMIIEMDFTRLSNPQL